MRDNPQFKFGTQRPLKVNRQRVLFTTTYELEPMNDLFSTHVQHESSASSQLTNKRLI
jgi:hypothetical protein